MHQYKAVLPSWSYTRLVIITETATQRYFSLRPFSVEEANMTIVSSHPNYRRLFPRRYPDMCDVSSVVEANEPQLWPHTNIARPPPPPPPKKKNCYLFLSFKVSTVKDAHQASYYLAKQSRWLSIQVGRIFCENPNECDLNKRWRIGPSASHNQESSLIKNT